MVSSVRDMSRSGADKGGLAYYLADMYLTSTLPTPSVLSWATIDSRFALSGITSSILIVHAPSTSQ